MRGVLAADRGRAWDRLQRGLEGLWVNRGGLAGQRGRFLRRSLLVAGVVGLGCGTDIELFSRVTDNSSTGGESGLGGQAAAGGQIADGGTSGSGASLGSGGMQGFSGALLALRLNLLTPGSSLGVSLRTVSFELQNGDTFPSTPLASDDPVVQASDPPDNDFDPLLAFDGNPSTWWQLRERLTPGALTITSTDAIDDPVSISMDLHQSDLRAPTAFNVEGFDGDVWWTLLAVRDFVWNEPTDEDQRQKDFRKLEIPPRQLWTR